MDGHPDGLPELFRDHLRGTRRIGKRDMALNDVMPRGSFLVSREALRVMRAQRTGGSIIYVVSKNALAVGGNAF